MILYSGYYSGKDPFGIFERTVTAFHPTDLNSVGKGALILWGGEDISPSIYKQKVVRARAGEMPSRRDQEEIDLFQMAVKLGMPIIGICRGAQLSCALSGGTLFQDLDGGHHDTHIVDTYKGGRFATSSCHHQAMNVLNMSDNDYELLAWDHQRSTHVHTENSSFETIIPEVINFKETNAFAIQGHPEWMTAHAPFVKWCANEIKARYF